MIRELLAGEREHDHRIRQLFATGGWIRQNQSMLRRKGIEPIETSPSDLKKISTLVTPQPVLATVTKPRADLKAESLRDTTVLAFEAIRDPGNLGTIIRTADWFGIGQVVCSPDSTDLYNPKVVQATMGAITRVQVHYHDLEQLLSHPALKGKAIYGTFLEGENIYRLKLDPHPLILFGNESQGLSDRYDRYIEKRISIPSFSQSGKGSESLNVASSAAVVCSELRRG